MSCDTLLRDITRLTKIDDAAHEQIETKICKRCKQRVLKNAKLAHSLVCKRVKVKKYKPSKEGGACPHCNKEFKARGLNNHVKSCKKGD
jgi:uncharacterized protein with PIN domain